MAKKGLPSLCRNILTTIDLAPPHAGVINLAVKPSGHGSFLKPVVLAGTDFPKVIPTDIGTKLQVTLVPVDSMKLKTWEDGNAKDLYREIDIKGNTTITAELEEKPAEAPKPRDPNDFMNPPPAAPHGLNQLMTADEIDNFRWFCREYIPQLKG